MVAFSAIIAMSQVAEGKFSSSRSSSSSSRSTYSNRSSASSVYNRGSSSSSSGSKKATTNTSSTGASGSKQSSTSTQQSGTGSQNKATTVTTTTTPKATYSNQSKSPLTSGAKQTALTKGSRFDRNTSVAMSKEKAAQSKLAYQTEQAKFKQPAPKPTATVEARRTEYNKSPIFSRSHRSSNYSADDHYARRDSYYRSSGWSTPTYVYMSQPSFGMWDAMFWWWILDNNDSKTVHNHYNDPGFQEWKSEAERLSKDNLELAAKLGVMENEIKDMEKKGVARDPNYLPEGVDPEVALSLEAMAIRSPEEPTIKVATGVSGGNYERFGKIFSGSVQGVKVETVPSAGSLENLKNLQAGKVDAAIVQSDTFEVLNAQTGNLSPVDGMQATLYSEYVMLLVADNSKIKSIEDLNNNNKVFIGPKGSGTSVTWQGFCLADSRYKNIPTENLDYDQAFKSVASNPDQAALVVIGVDSTLLSSSRTNGLKLVPVNDNDLVGKKDSDGNQIYDSLWIEKSAYPHLLSNDLETLSIDAVWILLTDWVNGYDVGAFDSVNYGVAESISSMHVRNIETTHSNLPKILMWLIIGVLSIGAVVLFVTKFNVTGGRQQGYSH